MFKWYAGAEVCYVYLDDVDVELQTTTETLAVDRRNPTCFSTETGRSSEWFERSWTLQELIAPKKIQFFDRGWRLIGSESELVNVLAYITGIDVHLLAGWLGLHHFSVAQRMAWAAHRKASRVEDIAYSLLGIFDVNMAMLYGEGRKAFLRLQQEIIRASSDQSIFAWQSDQNSHRALLAESPSYFAHFSDISLSSDLTPASFQLTNVGLEIELPVFHLLPDPDEPDLPTEAIFGLLHCVSKPDAAEMIALHLEPAEPLYGGTGRKHFWIDWDDTRIFRLPYKCIPEISKREPITISDDDWYRKGAWPLIRFGIMSLTLELHSYVPTPSWGTSWYKINGPDYYTILDLDQSRISTRGSLYMRYANSVHVSLHLKPKKYIPFWLVKFKISKDRSHLMHEEDDTEGFVPLGSDIVKHGCGIAVRLQCIVDPTVGGGDGSRKMHGIFAENSTNVETVEVEQSRLLTSPPTDQHYQHSGVGIWNGLCSRVRHRRVRRNKA